MKRPLLLALLVAAVGTFQSAVHVSGATVERKVRQVEPNIGCTAAGFFVHPNDCTRFYRCVDFFGTGERFSIFFFDCPAGTIFDETLSVCNHPEWVMGPLSCMGGGNPSTTSVPDSSSVESSTNPVTDFPVTSTNPPDTSVEPTSPPFTNPEPTNAPSTSVEPTNPPFTNPAPTNAPSTSVEPTNPPFTNPAPTNPSVIPVEPNNQPFTIPAVTTPVSTNPPVTEPAPTNPPVTSQIPPMSSPEPTNPPFTNPEPTNPPATIPVQTNPPPTAAPVTLAPSTEAPVITSATATNPPATNPPPSTSQSTESPLTTLPTIAPNTMVFPTEAPVTNPPPTTSQSTSLPTVVPGAIVFPTEAPDTSTASPVTTTAAPFVLTCGSKKFYRHPLRCDLYYQCLWSGIFNINILACPQGTNFDEDSSTCLPPDQTKPCQVMEWSTTQPLPTAPPTTTTTVSQQFTLAAGSLYDCKRPGHFPYELDCIRFYRCFEVQPGVLKGLLYRCPSGYGYDSKVTQRCQKQQSLPPVCDRSDLVRSGSIPIPIIPLEDTTAVRIEDLESFFRNVNSFYLPRG